MEKGIFVGTGPHWGKSLRASPDLQIKFLESLKNFDKADDFRRTQAGLIARFCDCKPDSSEVCKALLEFLKSDNERKSQ